MAFCLSVLVAGCALTRASGKVHEQGLIAPDQKLAILWTIGTFTEANVLRVLARDVTRGKQYELCTNALIEQTFRANGYVVVAGKVEAGARPAAPADARYVLFLRNTTVRFQATAYGSYASPFGAVLLDVEGDLVDRKTGKRLWTVYSWLASDAKRNSITSLHLVRGLAADGYLSLKPEDAVDYLGSRVKSDEEIALGCP